MAAIAVFHLVATEVGAGDLLSLVLGPLGGTVMLIVIVVTVVRGDWIPKKSHEAICAGKDQEKEEVVAGKDAVILELRDQIVRERQNTAEWRQTAREAHRVAKEATDVVTAVVPSAGKSES